MKLSKVLSMAAVLGLAASPMLSFAAVDVTGATSAFSDAGTAFGTIGAAMITAVCGGIVAKWVVGFLL